MPRPAPPRRTPAPRKKILWRRAAPIFVLMMAALFASQYFLLPLPQLQGSFLTANGGLALSLIAGLVGAYLISRYATEAPPPLPSKTQLRKQAAAARTTDDEEEDEEELVPATRRTASGRRRRRRR